MCRGTLAVSDTHSVFPPWRKSDTDGIARACAFVHTDKESDIDANGNGDARGEPASYAARVRYAYGHFVVNFQAVRISDSDICHDANAYRDPDGERDRFTYPNGHRFRDADPHHDSAAECDCFAHPNGDRLCHGHAHAAAHGVEHTAAHGIRDEDSFSHGFANTVAERDASADVDADENPYGDRIVDSDSDADAASERHGLCYVDGSGDGQCSADAYPAGDGYADLRAAWKAALQSCPGNECDDLRTARLYVQQRRFYRLCRP